MIMYKKNLVARGEDANLWYRRLGYASMRLLQKLSEVCLLLYRRAIRYAKHASKINWLDPFSST